MNQFKIVPLSEEYATKIRETNKDDFGHEVLKQVATGKGPCRVSLRPFAVGEDERLLLSHSPVNIDNKADIILCTRIYMEKYFCLYNWFYF